MCFSGAAFFLDWALIVGSTWELLGGRLVLSNSTQRYACCHYPPVVPFVSSEQRSERRHLRATVSSPRRREGVTLVKIIR